MKYYGIKRKNTHYAAWTDDLSALEALLTVHSFTNPSVQWTIVSAPGLPSDVVPLEDKLNLAIVQAAAVH